MVVPALFSLLFPYGQCPMPNAQSQMPGVLALITARGGSKGIPGKNIRVVGGKPLLAWSIEAAKGARCVERVVLSTDSAEIREVGVRCGAEAPFLRPPELAADTTPGVAPVLHAVRWLEENEDYRPAYILLLQPTTPLRTAGDISAAFELIERTNAPAVESVRVVKDHPYWLKSIDDQGVLHSHVPGKEESRRQDLPPLYVESGAIYLIRREVLLAQGTMWPPGTVGYVMPEERSLDIDSPTDLAIADLLLGGRQP